MAGRAAFRIACEAPVSMRLAGSVGALQARAAMVRKANMLVRFLRTQWDSLPRLQAQPTPTELGLVHVMYWASLALLAWPAVQLLGRPLNIGMDRVLAVPIAISITCTVLLAWSVRGRDMAPESWFVSHLVWLAVSHWILLLWAAGTAMALALGALLALVFPLVLVVLIYGPFVVGLALGAWFAYRSLVGYVRFLRRRDVDPWRSSDATAL